MSVAVFEPLTKPTAAQLNAISSSQAGLWALNGGINRELMAAVWEGSGSSWTFLHVHRWLLYDSTGQIEDPAGIEDDVSLADPPTPGELGVKDLNTVDWLAPGMLYRVTGCAGAWERSEPPSS
jgi:hypothetical protein